MNDQTRLTVPPLPQTVTDLLAQRKSLRTRSLNDDVEDIHLRLWELDPEYKALFESIWPSETVEGSFIADDMRAAMKVRECARDPKRQVPLAARAKLQGIVRSLHVVAKRYGISRKERQGMVGGEIVRNNNDSDE